MYSGDEHWQSFFNSFKSIAGDIEFKQQELNRLLKENGVTFNVYDDPEGVSRNWKLDVIPLLVDAGKWQFLERGLKQRANLLNLILKDIYGERKLLKDNIIPAELLFNHPGFIRECDGVMIRRQHSLVIYSANMARSKDGRYWIVNDRTQSPSGYGYALENRMAFARGVPELFNDIQVRWLSPFFENLESGLNSISKTNKVNPKIVILTPGAGHESFFEHSYLASYLGFTLVNGKDLVVKDDYVWLKTMNGLERVDVILRRVNDLYCDPLELKQDSELGVPGLLNVVRCGNVSLANPIGSSILESPGLMPFLNNACKYLLGEDLILPNIATWWCGHITEKQYVFENLDNLIIKRTHREGGKISTFDGCALSDAEKQNLMEQINLEPYCYVGQEKIDFEENPSYENGIVKNKHSIIRTFLVANKGEYHIMNGALALTNASDDSFLIKNQTSGISKDVWIMGHEPEIQRERKTLLGFKYRSNALPSHTAENLFWVGRYTERYLSLARFLQVVMQAKAEGNRLTHYTYKKAEHILLQALTHYSFSYPGFLTENGYDMLDNPWPELRSLLLDNTRSGTLYYNFNLFKNAIYSVRDHWSNHTWRVLNNMQSIWQELSFGREKSVQQYIHSLDGLITGCVAFIGLNRESISRDQGWTMLDMGRKIEQCLLLINMIRSLLIFKQNDEVEALLLQSFLESNENLMNYRYK